MSDYYLSGIDEVSGETPDNPFLGEDLGFLPLLASSLMPTLLSRAAPLLMRSGMLSKAAGILSKVSPIASQLVRTRVPASMFTRAAQALAKGGSIPAVAQAAFAQEPNLAEQESQAIRETNPGNPYAQSLSQIRQEVAGMDESELKGYLEGASGLAGFGTLQPASQSIAERIAKSVSNVASKASPFLKKAAQNKFVQMLPGIGTVATAYNIYSAASDAYNRYRKPDPTKNTQVLRPSVSTPSVNAPTVTTAPTSTAQNWADLIPEDKPTTQAKVEVPGSNLAMLESLSSQPFTRSSYRPYRRRRRRRASVRTVVVERSPARTYRRSRKVIRSYGTKKRRYY